MIARYIFLLSFIVAIQCFSFGGFSISLELFQFIRTHIEPGKTILELGSGEGTGELAKYYTMYSIEHDIAWLAKYNTVYIYAKIVNYGKYQWYDINVLSTQLPKNYDVILVDGPPGVIGRDGFFYNLDLFKKDVMIIFDDVQRSAEMQLLKHVAVALKKTYMIYRCLDGKQFGVIY